MNCKELLDGVRAVLAVTEVLQNGGGGSECFVVTKCE